MSEKKRMMRWKWRDGAWRYGDGVNADLYKVAQIGGRWFVYLKGKQVGESLDTLDKARDFVPRHYVESAIEVKVIKKIA